MMKNVVIKHEHFQGRSIIFASRLSETDLKEFIENAYTFNITFVKKQDVTSDEIVVFKVAGIYLYAGINNISFEGIFYANDFACKMRTIAERLSVNHTSLWIDFMLRKYGEEYKNLLTNNY